MRRSMRLPDRCTTLRLPMTQGRERWFIYRARRGFGCGDLPLTRRAFAARHVAAFAPSYFAIGNATRLSSSSQTIRYRAIRPRRKWVPWVTARVFFLDRDNLKRIRETERENWRAALPRERANKNTARRSTSAYHLTLSMSYGRQRNSDFSEKEHEGISKITYSCREYCKSSREDGWSSQRGARKNNERVSPLDSSAKKNAEALSLVVAVSLLRELRLNRSNKLATINIEKI